MYFLLTCERLGCFVVRRVILWKQGAGLNVKDPEKEHKHFLSTRSGTIAHCREGGDRRKASGGLFSIARYFSCRRGLVENSMSRSRAACPSVGAGCAEQSAAAPSAFVRGQCWGDGLRVHAGSPLLAAEETSPKETGLFFLPPSLSFCDISGC